MEEIYKNLISSWRKAYDGLNTEERTRVQYIDDLRSPCQIVVVILENKKLRVKQQLLIISHFKDEPDCDIKVIGPINSTEISDKLLEAVKEKRFERPLPENISFPYIKTYSELVQSHLLNLISSFRNLIIQNIWTGKLPRTMGSSQHLLSKEVSVWNFIGILNNKAIKSIVKNSMESIKSKVPSKDEAQAPKETQKSRGVTAHGALIYPHLWVGSRPIHTFKEDMINVMYDRKSYGLVTKEVIVFERVGGLTWLATQEGLIAVVEADKNLAMRFLNTFMALLILRGTPAFVTRENELVEMTLEANTGKILHSHSAIILPRMLPLDPSFIRPRWQEESMSVMDINSIKQIWKDIGKIAKDEVTLDTLQVFGEVYTHFQKYEYSQTILLAWIMVEKWYESAMLKLSKLEKTTKRHSIKNINEIIKLLEAESIINTDVVSNMYQLRVLRNQVSHAIGNATREDAKLALETVFAILQIRQS